MFGEKEKGGTKEVAAGNKKNRTMPGFLSDLTCFQSSDA